MASLIAGRSEPVFRSGTSVVIGRVGIGPRKEADGGLFAALEPSERVRNGGQRESGHSETYGQPCNWKKPVRLSTSFE